MAVDSMGMQEYIPFTEGSIEALSCSGFQLTQTHQLCACMSVSSVIPVGLGVGVGAGEEVGAMLVAGVEAGEEQNTWHNSAHSLRAIVEANKQKYIILYSACNGTLCILVYISYG